MIVADYAARRAEPYRRMLITAIERFEAAWVFRRDGVKGRPPYPKDRPPTQEERDEDREWDHLRSSADRDLNAMEEALAALISAGNNDLVPEELIVCEETRESIGQGVSYNGIAYSLADVIGNFVGGEGKLQRVEIRRMASIDGDKSIFDLAPPGRAGANGTASDDADSDDADPGEAGVDLDVSDAAEHLLRLTIAHHQAVSAHYERMGQAALDQVRDEFTKAYWERWLSVAYRVNNWARDSVALAVAATSQGVDIKRLQGDRDMPYPMAHVDLTRFGTVLVRPDPSYDCKTVPEVIYAGYSAIGDDLCPAT